MADMVADVVKVDPPQGDGWRRADMQAEFGVDLSINYAFELDNRGKRSTTLDLEKMKAISRRDSSGPAPATHMGWCNAARYQAK